MESNDTSSLVNFNEIQQQLAETFNPQNAKEKTKEIFANLLLGMGVPFFVERLKEKLPEDVFKKITQLLKDPDNLGKNSLEFAKQVFKDKFLEPIKNELLEKIADEVPELRGIDLTNASLNDIKNTLAKGIIERMKAKLPPEIADRLPENFTQEDILNAVKTLGRDQALQFAKNNLPPEAYAELERNQEILTDPGKISDFVKGKLNDLQGQVEENFKTVKATVQSRIDEVKTAIKGKIDEATAEARNKIASLKQAQSDARKAWNDTKSEFNDRFKSAQNKLDEFKRNNPNAGQDDLQPLQDEVDRIKTAADQAKENFFNGQDDLTTQIQDAQNQVDQITQNLVEKVGNIRATISQRAQQVVQRGQQQLEETRAAAQDLQQQAEESISRAVPQEVRAVAKEGGNMFRSTETEGGEQPGLFDRFTSFVGEKTSQFKQFIGRLGDQTPKPPDTTGNIQYEPKYTMLQADEPETTFSERAIAAVSKNPALASYYGSESIPADQLLDASNKTKILPYKASARPVRQTSQPQFTEEELRAAEQARITGQTAAPQKVLPTIPKETASKPPILEEKPIIPEGEGDIKLPSAGGVLSGAVEGVGIGMGIYQLEQGIAQRNPAEEIGGGVPLATTGVSTAIRQAQPAPVEQQAPKPTTVQPDELADQGVSPAPKPTTVTPQAKPQSAISNETEGEVIGQQTEKTALKEGGTVLGEEGGEEGLFGGLMAGLSDIPVLGTLVDIAGILGSIFGAKALMKDKAPPPPIVAGSSYEPNL